VAVVIIAIASEPADGSEMRDELRSLRSKAPQIAILEIIGRTLECVDALTSCVATAEQEARRRDSRNRRVLEHVHERQRVVTEGHPHY